MDKEIKKEARKQYLHYFRFWFIAVGILAVAAIMVSFINGKKGNQDAVRMNTNAPSERVYDYADVLTDQEEISLREYIAKYEEIAKLDIVLVTISEDVEANGSWESSMMQYADDFYDNAQYGYNKVHGDGILLLDNWYEGQAGSWLSTCGSAYERFGNYEVDYVLDAVGERVESDPFEAYKAYVRETCEIMNNEGTWKISWAACLVISLIVSLIYLVTHMNQKEAEDTTGVLEYVPSGRPNVNYSADDFIRKSVVKRKIERSNSSGSSGRSGGGGGHKSSSGVSHGGGGRRR